MMLFASARRILGTAIKDRTGPENAVLDEAIRRAGDDPRLCRLPVDMAFDYGSRLEMEEA